MDNQKELNTEELDQVNGGGQHEASVYSSLIIKSEVDATPVIVENGQNVGTIIIDEQPKAITKSAPVIVE